MLITLKGDTALTAIGEFVRTYDVTVELSWSGDRYSVEFDLCALWEEWEDHLVDAFTILAGPRYELPQYVDTANPAEREILARIGEEENGFESDLDWSLWNAMWHRIADAAWLSEWRRRKATPYAAD